MADPSFVVHLCPSDDLYITPCCGQSPFELPYEDDFTLDPSKVTCYVYVKGLVINDGKRRTLRGVPGLHTGLQKCMPGNPGSGCHPARFRCHSWRNDSAAICLSANLA